MWRVMDGNDSKGWETMVATMEAVRWRRVVEQCWIKSAMHVIECGKQWGRVLHHDVASRSEESQVHGGLL
ncbi:hypothetical protein TSUD_368160 [Trifolium subterraneum]|uniref:Uncharacterized protein n=1 Tax=Trifolium subterraneum TaxID=3900 RepID=A0A2Z6LMB0_TRISU|nr:hypothetical protein TSUD_368160 [Trifolium subterraneum]